MSGQQTASACPHPEAVGTRWGDPISEERQAELQGYLDRWATETDHGERKGPFDKEPGEVFGVALTGADASWLEKQSGHDEFGQAPSLHLEGTDLSYAHLEGSALPEAYLERAILLRANLERANLIGAHLEGADLREAHLENAMAVAHLEGADLRLAYLENAFLGGARLEG